MKLKINVLFSTLFLIAFCFNSCKKIEDASPRAKQELTFSFDLKNLKTAVSKNLKCSYLKEAAKYVVLTIGKSNGEKLYESKKLELYNFGGSFISESLSLEVDEAPYKLTEFLVLDKDDNVIFAAPLEGSALAGLVTHPLPLSFTVSKNETTKVVPEVLSTELTVAKDFGYAAFDFNVIAMPIRFLVYVQGYNPVIKNWQQTAAKVIINGEPGDLPLYNDSIPVITDTIKIADGYDNYKISVSRNGFISKDTLLTNVQLKAYMNHPLIFSLLNENETVTDIDGNVYNTVKIGTQVWMTENLKVKRYRNGDQVVKVTTSSDRFAGSYETLTYFNIQGVIYNWFAVSDSRNLAPAGWHIPTDEDWTTLVTYLGGDDIAGGKLKETGTAHWQSPNVGATNESGFTALPFFTRVHAMGIPERPESCGWWSSTSDKTMPCFRSMNYQTTIVSKVYVILPATNSVISEFIMSVRCIKD